MRVTEKNTLKPTKGGFKGHKLIIFDAVQKCRGEDCPLRELCPYENTGKCTVETKYVDAVFDAIIDDMGDSLTQKFLNKVSLHLMPLFGMLVKMKKVALAVEEPTYVTAQGQVKMHPIYEEIRRIISAIERTQRSLGMDGEYLEAKKIFRGQKDGAIMMPGDDGLPPANADADYVDYMISAEDRSIKAEIFPEGTKTGVKRVKRSEED